MKGFLVVFITLGALWNATAAHAEPKAELRDVQWNKDRTVASGMIVVHMRKRMGSNVAETAEVTLHVVGRRGNVLAKKLVRVVLQKNSDATKPFSISVGTGPPGWPMPPPGAVRVDIAKVEYAAICCNLNS